MFVFIRCAVNFGVFHHVSHENSDIVLHHPQGCVSPRRGISLSLEKYDEKIPHCIHGILGLPAGRVFAPPALMFGTGHVQKAMCGGHVLNSGPFVHTCTKRNGPRI